MRELNIPAKLIRLCRACYQDSRLWVRVGGERTVTFAVESGVRQGCPLAPTLFNIALEWVMRRTPAAGGVRMGGQHFDRLAYADDVDIMGGTLGEISAKTESFAAAAGRVGLHVNSCKTKVMKISRDEPITGLTVDCGGMGAEAVGVSSILARYLEVELLSRIGAAARCAASLRKLMTSGWISSQTKVKVYQTIIRPVVTYGCDAWRMTGGMGRRLDVFESGILRLLCGAVFEGGVWRRRHNAEILEMTGVPLLSDVVRSHRLRWAGHVARRGENSLLQIVLNAVPEGRKPAGRPGRRWRDAVNEDLRLLGRDEDWQQIAQDIQDWRELVSAARGLHGLQPVE